MTAKQLLRARIRPLVRAVPPEQKAAEAATVFRAIEQSEAFKRAASVMLYYSLPDELPTHEVVGRWHRMGKVIYLPRVAGDDLEVVRYDGEMNSDNRFHIAEPTGEALAVNPDLIVVPAVALDTQCHRMGRGKGFYDRFLHGRPGFKLGVALSCQLLDEPLPVEPHDEPLDAVFTARKIVYKNAL